MDLGIGDRYKRRDITPQIKQCMDLYPAFRCSKPRPWKNRTAQINCGCIQCVNRFIKLETKVIISIKLSGPDQSVLVQSHSKYANHAFRWHQQVYFWQFRSECQRGEACLAWRVNIAPYRGGSLDRLAERTPCKETVHSL